MTEFCEKAVSYKAHCLHEDNAVSTVGTIEFTDVGALYVYLHTHREGKLIHSGNWEDRLDTWFARVVLK